MKCPKCDGQMEKVTYQSIEIDRCGGCNGIWFDMLEHKDLKNLDGSESIDVGDRKVGKEQNKIGKVDCPVCQTPMIPMVEVDQPHIWYEGCSVCGGVYFDAGEFEDFKKETVLDFFKGLATPEREES